MRRLQTHGHLQLAENQVVGAQKSITAGLTNDVGMEVDICGDLVLEITSPRRGFDRSLGSEDLVQWRLFYSQFGDGGTLEQRSNEEEVLDVLRRERGYDRRLVRRSLQQADHDEPFEASLGCGSGDVVLGGYAVLGHLLALRDVTVDNPRAHRGVKGVDQRRGSKGNDRRTHWSMLTQHVKSEHMYGRYTCLTTLGGSMEHRGHPLNANISILFTEYDYLDRFGAARDAGFDAVESWWPFVDAIPARGEVDAMLSAIDTAGVRLEALNFWAGDMAAGQRGMTVHRDRHEELRTNIRLVAEIGEATGCRGFNLLYGQPGEGSSEVESRQAAAEIYRDAAEVMEPIGGKVLLEALAHDLNGTYSIRSLREANDFLDFVGDSGVLLLFDTFHLGHNGEDIVAASAGAVSRIGHVQVADDPGRGEPGSGKLPIDACLDALAEHGYTGRVGAEYKPTTVKTIDSFGWIGGDAG